MKIRFLIVPLLLVASLFVVTGCKDKGDPAWGEKQKPLLEELLNKPAIKHGEIAIDYKKKEWVIPNLEVTLKETEDMRSFCTIESVTGVNVALEPIAEENGILAEKVELKGLACQVVAKNSPAEGNAATSAFKQDSLVVENLKGSKDLQKALLSFGSEYSMDMLKDARLDRFAMNGVSVLAGGVEASSLESLELKNLAEGFVGPVQMKKLTLSPPAPGLKNIIVDSLQVKKIGSSKLLDELKKLNDSPSDIAFSAFMMSVDFVLEDMEYQNVSFNFDGDVPPVTIAKAVGSTSFDGKTGASSSKMEGLKIDPKTAQHFAPAFLKDYAFKPVDLSMTTDINIANNEGEYTFDYKKIQVTDPLLGSLNMAFGLIGGNDLFQFSGTGDMPRVKVKGFTVSLEDIGWSDMGFEIASLGSGSGLEGASAMRMMAVAGLQMQCGQLPANLQGACKDTASFLEKKGTIEYSFNPAQPLELGNNLLQDADKVEVVSKYTPAK